MLVTCAIWQAVDPPTLDPRYPVANNLFLTSIVRPAPDNEQFVERLHECLISLYGYLQNHPDATVFDWTWPVPVAPWYTTRPAPFQCKAGPYLRWYHSIADTIPYKTTADERKLCVLAVSGYWLKVLDAPEIWVRAEDCEPV